MPRPEGEADHVHSRSLRFATTFLTFSLRNVGLLGLIPFDPERAHTILFSVLIHRMMCPPAHSRRQAFQPLTLAIHSEHSQQDKHRLQSSRPDARHLRPQKR